MQLKVSDACPSRCGVRVEGEVDLDTREFVHRFGIPAAAATLVTPNETEVDRMRLVTFGPEVREWFVECPVCRARIAIPSGT